jgi:hypothetical protein
MPKKRITPDERRHQDYLRRKGLKVGAVYEARLYKARAQEVRRVLNLCKDVSNPAQWPGVIEANLDETGYLPKWFQGLFVDAGLPMCKSTSRDLLREKAAADDATNYWLRQLRQYATNRAGSNIVIVSGTLRETLINILRTEMAAEVGLGIEKLTKRIYAEYGELAKWQVRRIAQTESMVAMADAAYVAAETLDVAYTKQWCISGLGNTRDSHEIMDGIEVDQDEPFVLAGGRLLYPHDDSLGAAAAEIINCACSCIRRPKKAGQAQTTETPAGVAANEAREARIQELMEREEYQSLSDEAKRIKAENDYKLETAWGIKKGDPKSIEGADKQSANPNYDQGKAWQMNCATCTPAYALRKEGYDIIAKECVDGSGSLNAKASMNPWQIWNNADGTPAKPITFQDWMKDNEYKAMTSDRYKKFFDTYCKEEGTYELVLNWKGGGGHATILERLSDGTLVCVEPQKYWEWRGVTYKPDFTISSMKTTPDFRCGVMRLNDKLLNPDWAGLFDIKS